MCGLEIWCMDLVGVNDYNQVNIFIFRNYITCVGMFTPNLEKIGYGLTYKIISQIKYSKPILSLNSNGITKRFGGIKDI